MFNSFCSLSTYHFLLLPFPLFWLFYFLSFLPFSRRNPPSCWYSALLISSDSVLSWLSFLRWEGGRTGRYPMIDVGELSSLSPGGVSLSDLFQPFLFLQASSQLLQGPSAALPWRFLRMQILALISVSTEPKPPKFEMRKVDKIITQSDFSYP